MNIFSRILQFIDSKGISKNKFSNEIGLSNSYMTKMEGNSSIGSKIILKIVSTYPDLNLNWLFTGQGEMLRSGAAATGAGTVPECGTCRYKQDIERYQEDIARYLAEIDRLSRQLAAKENEELPAKRRSA